MASTPASRPGAGEPHAANSWTADEIALLGVESDRRVAERIGRTQMAVTLKRTKLGIPPHNPGRAPKRTWETPDNWAKLGKMPDATLAAELGVHVSSVCAARQARSIPPYSPRNGRPKGGSRWADEANAAMLGTAPDHLVAAHVGVSRTAVVSARKRRGIPPMTDTPATAVANWQARLGLTDRAAAAALGMSLSAYQAQKLGRENGKPRAASRVLLLACAALEAGIQPVDECSATLGAVRRPSAAYLSPHLSDLRFSWTPEQIALLGTDTDIAVAKLIGKNRATVVKARQARGIPPFSAHLRPKFAWTSEAQSLLGTMPDSALAERLGCTPSNVTAARKTRGIPRFRHSR